MVIFKGDSEEEQQNKPDNSNPEDLTKMGMTVLRKPMTKESMSTNRGLEIPRVAVVRQASPIPLPMRMTATTPVMILLATLLRPPLIPTSRLTTLPVSLGRPRRKQNCHNELPTEFYPLLPSHWLTINRIPEEHPKDPWRTPV